MKNIRILSVILAALMLCAVLSPVAYAKSVTTVSNTTVARLSGISRYDTACDISNEVSAVLGSEHIENVIIANGLNYADALAGVPLAENLNAPILLTKGTDSLETSVMTEIRQLGAKNAFILGGTIAVSEDIEYELTAAGLDVTRLYGTSRYDTAAEIANYNARNYSMSSTLFLASGANFPDALSAGAVAGIIDAAVLFCPPDGEIKDNVGNFICSNNISKVVIVGGSIAVSGEAEKNLNKYGVTFERVYGASRYDTAIAVYNEYESIFTDGVVSFATGANFPDALTGGVLSAEVGAPVLLVRNNGDNTNLKAAIADEVIKTAYVYGGASVVSDNSVKSVLSRDTYLTTTSTSTTTAAASDEIRTTTSPISTTTVSTTRFTTTSTTPPAVVDTDAFTTSAAIITTTSTTSTTTATIATTTSTFCDGAVA